MNVLKQREVIRFMFFKEHSGFCLAWRGEVGCLVQNDGNSLGQR